MRIMKPRMATTATRKIKKSDIMKVRTPQLVRFQNLLLDGGSYAPFGSAEPADLLLSIAASFCIGLKHFLNRTQLPRIRCRNRVFDDPGNLIERDVAFEEGGHGHFIGRIQSDRFGSPGFDRCVGQTETREFTHVWREEVQSTQVSDREAHIRFNAFWIRQSVEDGQAHIGYGELSKYTAIHEFHHGMNCGLRVDNDFHFGGRKVKQSARLDDFEAFVHQSCGIDGNALAHFPGGMVEGFLHRDGVELRSGSVEKRATGGSEPDPFYLFHSPATQALVNGVVFAIDGQQWLALLASLGGDQLAGGYKTFFIGHADGLTGFYGFVGGFESG